MQAAKVGATEKDSRGVEVTRDTIHCVEGRAGIGRRRLGELQWRVVLPSCETRSRARGHEKRSGDLATRVTQ